MTRAAGAAPPAIELIGIDKSFGPGSRQQERQSRRRARRHSRHRRRERRGQIDADVDPLWLLRSRLRRNPDQRRDRSHPLVARGDQPRHRHGPPALHAGSSLERARERHARRRGRRAACARARAPSASGSPSSAGNTASRSTRKRSSASCRSASSSGSRSSRRWCAGPKSWCSTSRPRCSRPPRPTSCSKCCAFSKARTRRSSSSPTSCARS